MLICQKYINSILLLLPFIIGIIIPNNSWLLYQITYLLFFLLILFTFWNNRNENFVEKNVDITFAIFILILLIFSLSQGIQPKLIPYRWLIGFISYLYYRKLFNTSWQKQGLIVLKLGFLLWLAYLIGHYIVFFIYKTNMGMLGRCSYSGQLIAIITPIAASYIGYIIISKFNLKCSIFFQIICSFVIIMCITFPAFANSRSAILALIFMILIIAVLIIPINLLKNGRRQFQNYLYGFLLFVGTTILSYYLYLQNPMSVIGRFNIWKITLRLIRESSVFGVGIGEFPGKFSICQGKYFALCDASIPERMSASIVTHCYNDIIEIWSECGWLGLIALILLIITIIQIIYITLFDIKKWIILTKKSTNIKDNRILSVKMTSFGMAGALLTFLFISTCNFPGKILQTQTVATLALAWLVSINHSKKT